jgi:hypothetical protein
MLLLNLLEGEGLLLLLRQQKHQQKKRQQKHLLVHVGLLENLRKVPLLKEEIFGNLEEY